ncbi:dTDP-glucose 4,6-dehydratase [Paucidesulfovibrio gracilis DSM 16080]|uniref:dTDP-glucose 4,6-dehydratase n=1 Tax=Paucidesulfovibrio gracilis DSM 16080 TaxID=1121449 RepID=A0A1T4WJI8_9BACT|nr:dTDP-glucose 4,6-dehydratase [Paucidesulfovibrio gracilis]SKA76791.1 dTDP-glucose 4,6-dehydratase [Paucidesulfovibrio gracilis DSM 16080]
MNILVTGGCGFIGTNFIRLMRKHHPDWSIINLDLLTYAGNRTNLLDLEQAPETAQGGNYIFAQGDIRDPRYVSELLTAHHIQAVVNFAAESHVDRSINDPSPFVTTNVQGTQNLLECSRKFGVQRFVQVSTDEVYGSLGPEGAFTEMTPLAPNSPYSASKAGADLMVRAYVETYGLDAVITRCSNNYGPYQFPEKLIPLMFTKARNQEPLPIYGDGSNVRDWIYVDDHCRGVELALLKGRTGQAYNFGGQAERSNLELVKTLLDQLECPHSLIHFVKDRPGHDQRYAMDFSLAEKELGFTPQMTFEQGLQRTLNWYRDHSHWLEQVQSGAYRSFMDQWYGERQ